MPPLYRALPFAQMDGMAQAIGKDLNLDVTGVLQQLFDIDRVVSKSRLRLGARGTQRASHRRLGPDVSQSLATPAGRRLQHDGITDPVGCFQGFLIGFERVGRPGNHRDAMARNRAPCFDLRTHQGNGIGGRADERSSGRFDGAGKFGIFGQESIARVDRDGFRPCGHIQNLVDDKVRLRGRGRTDRVGFIRHTDM